MTIQQVEQVVFHLPEHEQLRLARSTVDRVLIHDPKSVDGDVEDNADALFGIWADDPRTEDVDHYVRTLRQGQVYINN